MRNLLCFIFLFTLVFSCEKDIIQGEVPPLPLVWKLEATLFDPGDGSGVFESVDSDRKITFNNSQLNFIPSKVVTNGSFCDLMAAVGPETEAVYDPFNNQIMVEDCDALETTMLLEFEISEDQEIFTVSLPCDNSCQLRFRII